VAVSAGANRQAAARSRQVRQPMYVKIDYLSNLNNSKIVKASKFLKFLTLISKLKIKNRG